MSTDTTATEADGVESESTFVDIADNRVTIEISMVARAKQNDCVDRLIITISAGSLSTKLELSKSQAERLEEELGRVVNRF